MALNKARGEAAEKEVEKELIEKYGEKNVKSQVTIKAPDGTKTRADFVVKDNDKIQVIEVKTGNAKLTKNQLNVSLNGGTFVGENAGGLAGKTIPGGSTTIFKR